MFVRFLLDFFYDSLSMFANISFVLTCYWVILFTQVKILENLLLFILFYYK